MRTPLSRLLPCLCLLLIGFASLTASGALAQSPIIRDVEIDGTSELEASQLLLQLESTIGADLDRRQVRNDLHTIFATGTFTDVRAEVEPLPERDGYRLRFVVLERPRIVSLKVEGIRKISRDETIGTMTIKELDTFDPAKVQENVRIIRDAYRKKGFNRVTITPQVVELSPTERALTFSIEEQPRVFLTDLSVQGSRFYSELDIKRFIMSAEIDCTSWMNSSGIFQEEMINQDLALIAQQYLKNGYIKVFIDKPDVELVHNADYSRLSVALRITEGEQYFTGKVEVSGDLMNNRDDLLEQIQLESGAVYNPFLQNQDRSVLTEAYTERGYAFARVIPRTTIHEDNRTVDVNYQIIKGEKAYIGRLEIDGNAETRDHVIRREFEVLEEQLFNGKKLRMSQENLTRLGFFEQGLTLDRSPRAREDNVLDILARLKEGQTGSFQAQIGYSDVSGFTGGLSLSKGNLLGTGRTLRLNAQFAEKDVSQQFSATLIEPRLLGTRISSAVSASTSQVQANTALEQGSLTENSYGFSLGVPVYFRNLRFSTSVRALDRLYTTETPNLYKRSVTPSLEWNSVNHPIFPTAGVKASASVAQTGTPFGGNVEFREYQLNYQQFWSLNTTGTLIVMAKGHYGLLQKTGDAPIPTEDRYRMGGINTIRGHNYYAISGPYGTNEQYRNQVTEAYTDELGYDVIRTYDSRTAGLTDEELKQLVSGGIMERLFTTELLFPVSQDERSFVRGVVFLDAGNVNAEPIQYTLLQEPEPAFFDLRRSAGFGFRVISPVGVLRFEYGFKLDKREDETPDRFEFTISGLF